MVKLPTGTYTIINAAYQGKSATPTNPDADSPLVGRTVGLVGGEVWQITLLNDGKYYIQTSEDQNFAFRGTHETCGCDPVVMAGPNGAGSPKEWNITAGAMTDQYAIRTLETEYWYLVDNKPDATIGLTKNEEAPSILWVIKPHEP